MVQITNFDFIDMVTLMLKNIPMGDLLDFYVSTLPEGFKFSSDDISRYSGSLGIFTGTAHIDDKDFLKTVNYLKEEGLLN